jgi:hypothetical protein
MGRRKKQLQDLGECAYCPSPATTRDHIPPQGIFAKGMPNKPWVPCCLECNRGASKDDEYMQRIAMLCGAEGCGDAQDVEERFMRALKREEAKGLQTEILASLSPLSPEQELLFPGGINLALKGDRIGKIAEKNVRGWFFKLKGKRLPPGYEVMKYMAGTGLGDPVLLKNEELIEKCPGFFFGDTAFAFRVAFDPGDEFLTCWRLEFYKVFKVIAYTCKMGEETFQVVNLENPYQIPVNPGEVTSEGFEGD